MNFYTLYCPVRKKRGKLHKTLLVMKLTFLLIAFAFLHLSAATYAQKVTLNEKDASLEKVFNDIKKQTGYIFFYKADALNGTSKVTISVKDATLEEVLDRCFKDQPLVYTIAGKTVGVKKKEVVTLPQQTEGTPPPPNEIKGYVTNQADEPLPGASVRIKRTGWGAVTDAAGAFYLKDIKSNDTLIISFIGYSTKFVKIDEKISVYNIKLQETTNPLDQVVVQAYGETSQRLSTGDITTISAKEIESQTNMNALLDLQGRMAGVDVQATSGYASGPVRVTIRGLSTVNANGAAVDPLYVIDGVPLTVVQVGKTASITTGSYGFLQNSGLTGPANGQSPLFSLDPSTIESISVLKDADATSIYGSRGANGVVLITTKKGKAGKTQVTVNTQEGYSMVTRYWDMLNTPQYLAMRREAFRNDGITPTASNAPDLVLWDPNRYTDWQKALWGKIAPNNNTHLALSGGDTQNTFMIGANYTRSTEITTASGADQRAGLSFNMTHRSLDDKFVVSLTGQYSYAQSDIIAEPGQTTIAPNAPPIYNANGTLDWTDWAAIGIGNPFGILLQPYTAKTNFLVSNLNIKYQILHGLFFVTNFGYNTAQANQVYFQPIAAQNPTNNPTGSASFGNNNNKNWLVEPQLNYSTLIWKGKLSVLLGGSAQDNTTDGIFIKGNGYTNDALLHTISNAPSQSSSDNYGEYRYASVFTRIGYNIEDKYIINFNARRDGSSNYGPGNQYGNFASVGAAWLFTGENWVKNNVAFLSLGKLQASYGTSGSDGGIPYAYLTRWSSSGATASYSGIQPLFPTQHANPDYQWQQNRQLEISTNLGFFKDWVTVRASYYDRKTDNQLLSYPTAAFTGFSSVLENLPALVENKGWEFTVGGKGVQGEYFQWAPSFNFSFNQNKFVSFPGLGGTNYYKSGQIGQPLNYTYVLHFTGVDPQTGQYTYEDYNHDGKIVQKPISQGGDEYPMKLSPTFQTGFGFSSGFKGLKLTLFISVKKQNGINALAQGSSPGEFGALTGNQPVEVLNRWQYPGQLTNTGKFSTQGNQDPNGYLGSSDIGYTDASYIRLQNASLSYQLSQKLTKKLGMTACSFFMNANNLFTITGYKGIDPETQGFGGVPPVRTIVGGLSITF